MLWGPQLKESPMLWMRALVIRNSRAARYGKLSRARSDITTYLPARDHYKSTTSQAPHLKCLRLLTTVLTTSTLRTSPPNCRHGEESPFRPIVIPPSWQLIPPLAAQHHKVQCPRRPNQRIHRRTRGSGRRPDPPARSRCPSQRRIHLSKVAAVG
jgi:hypothetical protein